MRRHGVSWLCGDINNKNLRWEHHVCKCKTNSWMTRPMTRRRTDTIPMSVSRPSSVLVLPHKRVTCLSCGEKRLRVLQQWMDHGVTWCQNKVTSLATPIVHCGTNNGSRTKNAELMSCFFVDVPWAAVHITTIGCQSHKTTTKTTKQKQQLQRN